MTIRLTLVTLSLLTALSVGCGQSPEAPAPLASKDVAEINNELAAMDSELKQEGDQINHELDDAQREMDAELRDIQQEFVADETEFESDAAEGEREPSILARYHDQSAELLREASVAAANHDIDSTSSALKQSRQLTQMAYLLADIAEQQAAVADVTGVEDSLSRLRKLNEVRIAGSRLGADESQAIIALAVVYARTGQSEKAIQAIQRLSDEQSVVIGRPQEVLARGYAEICLALAAEGETEALADILERLERHCRDVNDVDSQATCMAQLARAQIGAGRVEYRDPRTGRKMRADRSLGTVQRIQQLANATAVNEALATIAVAQAQAGLPQKAQSTIGKITPTSGLADTARFELALLHARTLNFRDAILAASEIRTGFLKTRALYLILAGQLDCGPVFEESARKLVRLADEMREGFRGNATLHRQLRCDGAVAATKWELAIGNLTTRNLGDDPVERGANLVRLVAGRKAQKEVMDAVTSDLLPSLKAEIQISWARVATLRSRDGEELLRKAHENIGEEVERDVQCELYVNLGKACSEVLSGNSATDWSIEQSDSLVRSPMLLGLAKGIFEREELSRAADEGFRIAGRVGRTKPASPEGHRLWKEFLATIPEGLNPSGKPSYARLDGTMQMLAVPTSDGLDLAIPPALPGLKAWIAIAAKTVFSRDEAAGLAGFVESPLPIGSEQTIGRFVVRKGLCLSPNGWLVFSLRSANGNHSPTKDLHNENNEPRERETREEDIQDDWVESEALAAIAKIGGKVHRDDGQHGNPVTGITLANTEATDQDLKHLRGFDQLVRLSIGHTRITGTGFKYLRGMEKLKLLHAFGAPITDEGLKNLKEMSTLDDVALGSTKITDDGLMYLKGLGNLKHLNLAVTGVTDEGISHLATLKELEYLNTSGTKVTRAGVQKLSESIPGLNPLVFP